MIPLQTWLQETPYRAYSYSYPHKTAYRPFTPIMPLSAVWHDEAKTGLFLYLHIPFCEMRCGFCNLFTTVNADQSLERRYMDALTRQAEQVAQAIGPARYARMAIGGGTPTYLATHDLARLFDLVETLYGVDLQGRPISVETSPQTAQLEKLQLLYERGTTRISIGVQSFIESEVQGVGRAQRTDEVIKALHQIRESRIPTLNIDLIYGLPGQTLATWSESLQRALDFAPEELYLYPLYKRPLTGLDRMGRSWDDHRLACYRAGRDQLLAAGYTQVSMRMFRAPHAPTQDAPIYCCQEDGMVGLGCGARSYTRNLHYSTEYAVGYTGVRAILNDFVDRPTESFRYAYHGCTLNDEEQRRRYLIKSLLQAEGLALNAYQAWFTTSVFSDFPQLDQLFTLGLATHDDTTLRLTSQGLELSDTIGVWLYSDATHRLIEEYVAR
ncbi:MAG: STM4012 family radical SAM protein [Anaerolineae bacterium]|jgi:oxygen-independent coproporphyrinogen-3 oxidase|nr:STM4012 family radical SAM protein [Anaerolineae bacterium]